MEHKERILTDNSFPNNRLLAEYRKIIEFSYSNLHSTIWKINYHLECGRKIDINKISASEIKKINEQAQQSLIDIKDKANNMSLNEIIKSIYHE